MSADNLKDKLRAVLVNPQVTNKVLDSVIGNRPEGWSKRSHSSYYKEKFGLEAKAWVAQLMETREPLLFEYKVWWEKLGINRESLYNRVNMSIRYLCDRLDDDQHTAARFLEMCVVRREHGLGIRIEIRPQFLEADHMELKPRSVVSRLDKPVWKQDMDTWLVSSKPGDTFHRDRLMLTPQEIADLETELVSLQNVISRITSSAVKLLKTEPHIE